MTVVWVHWQRRFTVFGQLYFNWWQFVIDIWTASHLLETVLYKETKYAIRQRHFVNVWDRSDERLAFQNPLEIIDRSNGQKIDRSRSGAKMLFMISYQVTPKMPTAEFFPGIYPFHEIVGSVASYLLHENSLAISSVIEGFLRSFFELITLQRAIPRIAILMTVIRCFISGTIPCAVLFLAWKYWSQKCQILPSNYPFMPFRP